MPKGGPAQPSRAEAMNPNNAAYNPTAADAKGGNPSADRAAAFNPQHAAYNPTSGNGGPAQGGPQGRHGGGKK